MRSKRIVDLTEARRERAKPVFGRPTRCPTCGGGGYLDRIDMVDRVMFQHCRECGFKWETSEVQLAVEALRP